MDDDFLAYEESKEKLMPFYKKKWFIPAVAASSVVIIILIIVIAVTSSSSGDSEKKNNDNEPPNESTNETTNETTNESPYLCLDASGKPAQYCYGGWIYYPPENDSEYTAKWAKKHGWQYAFFSTYVGNDSGKKRFKENAIAFKKYGISYHAMTLESQEYDKYPDTATEQVQAILDYAKAENLEIAGIHTDYEPHGLDNWKGNEETLFQQYKQIVANVRKVVKTNKKLLYSAALPKFPKLTKEGKISGGRGYDLVNENMFDLAVPMLYDGLGDTAKAAIKYARMYLDDNVSTLTGLKYSEHESDFDNVVEQVNTTFTTEEGTKNIYRGVSVYVNHEYPDWNE